MRWVGRPPPAEAQVRAIKDDWRRVQRMADQRGITIHVETSQLSYIDPGTAEKRNEMEHRVYILESEIRSLVARAQAADDDSALPGRLRSPDLSADARYDVPAAIQLDAARPGERSRIVRIDDPTVIFPQPPLR